MICTVTERYESGLGDGHYWMCGLCYRGQMVCQSANRAKYADMQLQVVMWLFRSFLRPHLGPPLESPLFLRS
jgi:hypothetical protein